MTLHFTEGFDRYGAVADFALRYARNGGAYSPTAGVSGGGAFTTSASTSFIDFTFPSAIAHGAGTAVHAACWLKVNAFPSGTNPSDLLAIGTNQVGTGSTTSRLFGLLGDGTVWAKTHGGTHSPKTTAVPACCPRPVAPRRGRRPLRRRRRLLKLWVDRNLVVDVAGDTNTGATAPTSVTGFRLLWTNGAGNATFDDVLVWDEAGGDFAHAQLPREHLIETLSVDGDAAIQFARLGGSSNAENLDETGFHDGDTSYVESTAVGQADLYSLADQGVTPLQTLALAVHSRAGRPTPAGSRCATGSSTAAPRPRAPTRRWPPPTRSTRTTGQEPGHRCRLGHHGRQRRPGRRRAPGVSHGRQRPLDPALPREPGRRGVHAARAGHATFVEKSAPTTRRRRPARHPGLPGEHPLAAGRADTAAGGRGRVPAAPAGLGVTSSPGRERHQRPQRAGRLPDLTGTPAAIMAVQVSTVARKDDAGSRSLRAVLKSGATTADGAAPVLGTSCALYDDRFEVNPATGTAWTNAGVDALEAGIEVVA